MSDEKGCGEQNWFVNALHQREAQRDADGWKVKRLTHPIDGMALMVGPRVDPIGGYEDIYGSFVLVAMLPSKAWLTDAAPQYGAGLLLRLPGDNFGGLLFCPGEENLLTLRVEWSMESLQPFMKACPPSLKTIRAVVHLLSRDEFALQFTEEGDLFAPPTGDPFACVESVTFKVPRVPPHQELELTFSMAGVAHKVVQLCKAVKSK